MLLEGVYPAVTTPFYPDGRVYYKKIEHNMDRFSRTPCSGFAVLGSTGEAVMLSDEEQREVLKVAREFTAPHKVLLAGTGVESAINTLALTEYAATLGYDVALIRTPHYYRPQMKTANMIAYYNFIADRSPLPVVLYSVPPFTAYDLPSEAILELAGHPNIIGLKESSGIVEKVAHIVKEGQNFKRQVKVTEIFKAVTGRMLQAQAVASGELVPAAALSAAANGGETAVAPGVAAGAEKTPPFKVRTKEVGFQVMAGTAQKLQASLEVGAPASVLAFGAAAPTACYEIYAAFKDGDTALTTEKQQRIIPAATKVASELGVAGIKYAMDLNGYYGGPARLPFLPLTGEQRAQIEAVMADIRH